MHSSVFGGGLRSGKHQSGLEIPCCGKIKPTQSISQDSSDGWSAGVMQQMLEVSFVRLFGDYFAPVCFAVHLAYIILLMFGWLLYVHL